ncbi:hypothetical protein [Nannocystis radixulma]|uniref:Uncharacterized protein n=1 Tax=Nannocystis radixulma TaxID=2995305 RepID=A0ABT5BNB0_9BACT|nr:hypothetical protein [Nannocystis radixulma]MDC0674421.1 hypothetical protein [Nannocystis radixulma]
MNLREQREDTRAWRAVWLGLAFACGSPPPPPGVQDVAQELAQLARGESQDELEIAALGERTTDLRLRADRIATQWRLAKRDFEQAAAQYDKAVDTGRQASEHFASAIEDFQRAEQRYRQTALLIVAIAASAQLCASTASTRSFRAQLRAEGVDLTGQDIDHIWPRSLGGIDHPLNYQVLDAHLNRSLGAGVVQKFMTQPLALVQGLAVSALASLSC